MTLNAKKFFSISVQLSLEACNIVRQYSVDKNMKKYQKGLNNHVTEADYKIQSMLIKGFKMHFPGLKIIGQQTQEFKGQIDFDYSKLKENFLFDQLQINAKQSIDQCCLWIDPIDCTKGFIEGNFQDVTVLIGMSRNKHPQLGVIGIPFQKINETRIFEPEVLLGSVKDKKAYIFKNNELKLLDKIQRENSQAVLTTSNSRSNLIQQLIVEHLKAKNILAGGSGRKIALVIKGEADMMAYVGSATNKWDSCAGESIIRAMGGNFTTPSGNQIIYDPNEPLSENQVYKKSQRISGRGLIDQEWQFEQMLVKSCSNLVEKLDLKLKNFKSIQSDLKQINNDQDVIFVIKFRKQEQDF